MARTIEANKALLLEAFDTLFNKRDYKAAEHYWSSPSRKAGCRCSGQNFPVETGFAAGMELNTDHAPAARVPLRLMSALGHKRTYAVQKGMSALPPKADICSATRHVR